MAGFHSMLPQGCLGQQHQLQTHVDMLCLHVLQHSTAQVPTNATQISSAGHPFHSTSDCTINMPLPSLQQSHSPSHTSLYHICEKLLRTSLTSLQALCRLFKSTLHAALCTASSSSATAAWTGRGPHTRVCIDNRQLAAPFLEHQPGLLCSLPSHR